MADKRRIAVIGAGIAGIFSIKHLVEEKLEPVCFEKTETYGGTWFYRKETANDQASIMPTTILNSSKEINAFSDFPPDKSYPNYMKHTHFYKYITEYVKYNDIEKYIWFKMEVINVKKADDYSDTGKWYVTVKNLNTGEVSTEIYDGVFVATGHVNNPKMHQFPGQHKFKGNIMHTHSLKDVETFEGQNVVIVGMGCSALDAAVEISRVAQQVYLSTRSGAFVINRTGPYGYPTDYVLFRRYVTGLINIIGPNIASWYIETFYLDKFFDHHLYPVQPQYHVLSKDPIVSDHIGETLLNGSVIQKSNIKCFEANGVIFEEDECITSVDTVIMATGYTWGFPFLEKGILHQDAEIINLYKCMYPPHLPYPTLAFIGFFLSFGGYFAIAELQSRWAAYLLAGYGKLPSENAMARDVMKRHDNNKKRFTPNEKMTIRVDLVQFADELATEIGVKPNLLKYFFKDFELFLKLMFGPSVPYQYRLSGHGKWEGARQAIMTTHERVVWSISNRNTPKSGLFEYFIDYIANLISFFICKNSVNL